MDFLGEPGVIEIISDRLVVLDLPMMFPVYALCKLQLLVEILPQLVPILIDPCQLRLYHVDLLILHHPNIILPDPIIDIHDSLLSVTDVLHKSVLFLTFPQQILHQFLLIRLEIGLKVVHVLLPGKTVLRKGPFTPFSTARSRIVVFVIV